MATPATIALVAAKPAEQQAERVAGALYRAATTPILSRHTVKEVQTEDGPKLVEQQVNITPLTLLAGAVGLFVLGIGAKPVLVEEDTFKTVPNPAYVEWQRSGVNTDQNFAIRGSNAGIAAGFGTATPRDPAPAVMIKVKTGTKTVRRFRWTERPRSVVGSGSGPGSGLVQRGQTASEADRELGAAGVTGPVRAAVDAFAFLFGG